MEPEKLFDHVKERAAKINDIAGHFLTGNMGFAILIPEEATEEAKKFVDGELVKLFWEFQRCVIGRKEYYVLFPL